jgi:hypothetical protein
MLRLLDAIGLDRIRTAAEAAADVLQASDKVDGFLKSRALAFGDQALKTSQANVFRNLLFGGRQAQMSWEWLKGRKTTVDDAQTLGTQKQLVGRSGFRVLPAERGALSISAVRRSLSS